MTIPTLLVAWALGGFQSSPTLLSKYFPAPSGANGLEDYLYAMDLLQGGYWSAYSDWVPPEQRLTAAQQEASMRRYLPQSNTLPDPKLVELKDRLNGMNLLQVRSEEVSKFDKSLNLIATGNDKPCVIPKQDGRPQIPTASLVSDLGNLEQHSAYVSASQSHMNQAIASLTGSLLLADHSCRTTYIGGLMNTLNTFKVCNELASYFDRFSESDANQTEELVNEILALPPSFLDSFRASIIHALEEVGQSMRSLKQDEAGSTRDKTLSSFNQVVRGMSDAEFEQMITRVQQAISNSGQIFLARFNGPEEQWLAKDVPVDNNTPEPPIKTPIDVESYYINHWNLPEISRTRRLVDALRGRAMLRLVRLHARIISFRWENDRLPISLSEMRLPRGYDFDPLSTQSFVYELKPDGYKLYSKGATQSGRIELGANFYGPSRAGDIKP